MVIMLWYHCKSISFYSTLHSTLLILLENNFNGDKNISKYIVIHQNLLFQTKFLNIHTILFQSQHWWGVVELSDLLWNLGLIIPDLDKESKAICSSVVKGNRFMNSHANSNDGIDILIDIKSNLCIFQFCSL